MTEWSEIESFDSMADYVELKRRVDAAVSDGVLVPVPVRQTYANVGFTEQWYEERRGQCWRLIEPDFPFKGLFEKITG